MYFTYVVRPGEAPEGRGPQFEPFWSFIVNYSLRLGVFLLLGAYACLLMTVSAGKNDPLALLNVLRAAPESAGEPHLPEQAQGSRTSRHSGLWPRTVIYRLLIRITAIRIFNFNIHLPNVSFPRQMPPLGGAVGLWPADTRASHHVGFPISD